MKRNDRIEVGRKQLFDFDYPIFDEAYRNVFETHFIKEFYMREYGFETVGLFKLRLEIWLQTNMPYFNKLFQSELIEYDPLINTETKRIHNKKNDRNQQDKRDSEENQKANTKTDIDVNSREHTESNRTGKFDSESNGTSEGTKKEDIDKTGKRTGNETGEGTSENFNRQLQSDTPQERLQITPNEDGSGSIEYASKIQETKDKGKTTNKTDRSEDTTDKSNLTGDTTGKTHDETTGTSTEDMKSDTTGNVHTTSNQDFTGDTNKNENLNSDIKSTEDFIEHIVGKIGVLTYPEMIEKHRASFLRIERMIFKEMNQLFMLTYL